MRWESMDEYGIIILPGEPKIRRHRRLKRQISSKGIVTMGVIMLSRRCPV
jgi:hypothetical protein